MGWLSVMCGGAITASAIPAVGNLPIDFRDAAWNGANFQTSFSVGGVTATASGSLVPRTLYQDSTDGLGVRPSDEIENNEKLTIDFTMSAGQGVTGVWVTDLFGPPDGSGGPNGEVGKIALAVYSGPGAGNLTFYGAGSSGPNGEQFISFGGAIDIQKAVFTVQNDPPTLIPPSLGNRNDYSVAGFTKSVPDVRGTAMLLGLGIAGLMGLSRRVRN